MSTEAPHFGIDFGTTNSSMAWFNPKTGRAETIRNADKEHETPSLVYYGEGEEVLVGKDVVNLLEEVEDSDDQEERDDINLRVVKGIKRELASPVVPIPGGRMVEPVEVVAEILKKLKRDAEDGFFHERLDRVVLTYPATFGPREQKVLCEAASRAGFGEVELFEEPTAAAVAFSRLARKIGKGILVYDLGAGTFDLSVVTRDDDGNFRVSMEPQGDPRCGGNDFDLALYRYCEEIAEKELGRPISLTENMDLAFLAQCCERKENLTSREKSRFSSYLPSEDGVVQFKHEVYRRDFEELIRDRVEETVRQTASMLERAKEHGHQVNAVVLIGGASRVPLVKQRLKDTLPVEPIEFSERDYAVALGAAYHAHELWRPLPKPQSKPTEVVVAETSGADFQTIEQALAEVPSGGRIRVRPGVYRENLLVDKTVEIVGEGPTQDIVIEGRLSPCLTISAEQATIRGLTFRRLEDPEDLGREQSSAIRITARLATVEGCDISSAAEYGVTVGGSEASLTIRSCKIHDADDSGVCFYENAQGVVEECDIFGNEGGGVEISEGTDPTIRRCKIHDGRIGISVHDDAKGTVQDCDIFGNEDFGVLITDEGNPTIQRCKIHDGGTGISLHDDGKGTIQDCEILNHTLGGVQTNGDADVYLRRCTITKSGYWAIFAREDSLVYVENCDLTGNTHGKWNIEEGAKLHQA